MEVTRSLQILKDTGKNINMLEDKVFETIHKYNLIENGDRVVIGVSGGPDSICLAECLYNIKKSGKLVFDIFIAHVNHMIREEAKDDEEFVKKYAEDREIPFFSKSVDVIKISNSLKIGTEEAGRKARYSFFDEILKKVRWN